MPVTSGSYNTVSIIAQDAINDALKDIRQLPAGGSGSTFDLTDGVSRLNRLLKTIQTNALMLWLYDWVQVPLIQNQYRYTIGPNGDVDPGYRLLRAIEGSFIRTTCSPTPYDIALTLLSRIEYANISLKTQTGIPTSFYMDMQMRETANPVSYNPYSQGQTVLYVWPSPADSTRTIFLNVERPIQDITAAGQAFDIPTEWYEPIVFCLQARLADMYEVPEDRIRRIEARAKEAYEYMCAWGGQEWAPIRFQPSYQYGMYGKNMQ